MRRAGAVAPVSRRRITAVIAQHTRFSELRGMRSTTSTSMPTDGRRCLCGSDDEGVIDTHRHTLQTQLRALYADWTLADYRRRTRPRW
ncbi:hypothetical protein [Streptomyces torulosus]|uniref:hypothetical protein n=1 Tax=Streptomyces torulosus TaxID=68276 RepID=UPI0006EB4287|nr:hypothetical protein [Streptomyces torulosus]